MNRVTDRKIGVLRQIRANVRTRLLPIVILTTSHEESNRLQG
jgi:two-component system response regulator